VLGWVGHRFKCIALGRACILAEPDVDQSQSLAIYEQLPGSSLSGQIDCLMNGNHDERYHWHSSVLLVSKDEPPRSCYLELARTTREAETLDVHPVREKNVN
jgi:hypothetical protein